MFPVICSHVPLDLQGFSEGEEGLRTFSRVFVPMRLDVNLVGCVKHGTQLLTSINCERLVSLEIEVWLPPQASSRDFGAGVMTAFASAFMSILSVCAATLQTLHFRFPDIIVSDARPSADSILHSLTSISCDVSNASRWLALLCTVQLQHLTLRVSMDHGILNTLDSAIQTLSVHSVDHDFHDTFMGAVFQHVKDLSWLPKLREVYVITSQASLLNKRNIRKRFAIPCQPPRHRVE